LLVMAALFGAAHALTPGHGKTLVAAYLVGERGTVGQAVLLGLVTTLTHTAAGLVLAGGVGPACPRGAARGGQRGAGRGGGPGEAGLGVWLLLCRLSGRADHVHRGGGHHHHGHSHGHGHAEEPLAVRPGWWGLVVLGVSGGIVPCWDALAMLALAVSAQRL